MADIFGRRRRWGKRRRRRRRCGVSALRLLFSRLNK
jgi:hypothetical protein